MKNMLGDMKESFDWRYPVKLVAGDTLIVEVNGVRVADLVVPEEWEFRGTISLTALMFSRQLARERMPAR